MKTSILVSQREHFNADRNEWTDSLSQEWTTFIENCGYLPLPVPNQISSAAKLYNSYNSSVAGIVLTGGGDIHADQVHRDKTERALIEIALENSIPLFAICRGAQLLADTFGWRLSQTKGHVRTRHQIFCNPKMDPNLAKNFENLGTVNSFHDLALPIATMPKELQWLLSDTDQNAEAYSIPGKPILGLMWHPERETPNRQSELLLFQNLVQGNLKGNL